MTDRGEYRSIYVALADDPAFLALSPAARLSLLMLKLILGPSGISVVRALTAELIVLTGHTVSEVCAAIDELVKGDWIVIEGYVVWLRNGLRFEPSKPLASENGRKGISKYLETLPRVPLVNRFAEYYGLPCPFPEITQATGQNPTPPEPPAKGVGNPLPTPSEPPTEAGMRDEGRGSREEGDNHPSIQPREDFENLSTEDVENSEGGADSSGPSPSAATLEEIDDQISAVIVLANGAMGRNPNIDQRRLRPIPTGHGSRQYVFDWIKEGIPLELIRETVEDVALNYRPDQHNSQISTMGYFNGAVRQRHELQTAKETAGSGAPRQDARRSNGARGRSTPPKFDYSNAAKAGEKIEWPR